MWSVDQEMMPPPPSPPPPSRPHRDPNKEQHPFNCPRCNSSNTKFCYYNNYSLSQPRYLCKSCRRYWTEGGSLRNVPVGGGSRKNKRSSSSPDIPKKPKFNQGDYHHQPQHGEDLSLFFTTPQHPELIAASPSSMDVLNTSTTAVYSSGGRFGLQDLRSSNSTANNSLNFPSNGDMVVGKAGSYGHGGE